MNVTVKLFARARELAGADAVPLELPESACIGDLRSALYDTYPKLRPLSGTLLIAVNNDYARDGDPVRPDCEIACFPPVSGG